MPGIATTSKLREALQKASSFLVTNYERDGWWRDFALHVGRSDEWVSAYVGCALLEVGDADATAVARRAWLALEQRASGRDPGFGFSGKTTRDADSTAWACRLAAGVGEQGAVVQDALRFVETCVQEDGGIATYPSAAAVRRAILIPQTTRVDAWAQSHCAVTAAVAGIPIFREKEGLQRFLRARQEADGGWRGFWWADAEFATALAIDSLNQANYTANRDAVKRGTRYLREVLKARAAFPLALRVIGICGSGEGVPEDFVTELIHQQQADGSWAGSARLRIPFPNEMDPDTRWNWSYDHKGFGSVRLDEAGLFTTATAVWALSAVTRQ